jgi:signal transduction histidine kinase
MENLMSNALRYTPTAGKILVAARAEPGTVIVSVHNSGQPIPRMLQGRIFEKFDRGVGDKRRGWGLGLYFCRLAVAAHGGTIAVEDVPGWPVSFVIRLPTAHAADPGPVPA